VPAKAWDDHGQLGIVWVADNDSTYDEGWWNFDFVEFDAVLQENVDRPISMFFAGNAEVDKIKDAMWGHEELTANPCYLLLKDYSYSSSSEWVSDKGTKEIHSHISYPRYPDGPSPDFDHMRLYAPSAWDHFYNSNLGYYVLGTNHCDIDEIAPLSANADSEFASDRALLYINDHVGWYTQEDWNYLYNAEPVDMDHEWKWTPPGYNFHYYYNDGYAHLVIVP